MGTLRSKRIVHEPVADEEEFLTPGAPSARPSTSKCKKHQSTSQHKHNRNQNTEAAVVRHQMWRNHEKDQENRQNNERPSPESSYPPQFTPNKSTISQSEICHRATQLPTRTNVAIAGADSSAFASNPLDSTL